MNSSDSIAANLPVWARAALAAACLFLGGWGPEGHAIVARIAAAHLSAPARRQVEQMLGAPAADRMAAIASWADWQGRARPETKPWHYVDIEIDSAGYDAGRDCAGGNCIVAQIDADARILGAADSSPPAKVEALKWLIHLVGDLHQPLHCADRHDRGGNGVAVVINGYATNLHRLWDTGEVAAIGEDPVATAATLDRAITPAERRAWSRGGPEQWADESFVLARDRIYGRLPPPNQSGEIVIGPSQYRADSAIAALQLEKAGVRLSHILNAALGP